MLCPQVPHSSIARLPVPLPCYACTMPMTQGVVHVHPTRPLGLPFESLSNDGGDNGDDAYSKMNLYFASVIRNCLDLLSSPSGIKNVLRLTMQ